MKKFLFLLFSTLFLSACSDKLTNDKAEKSIKTYLEENPKYGTDFIYTGKKLNLSEQNIKNYEQLAKGGYLEIKTYDAQEFFGNRTYHSVKLTDKAKEFVVEIDSENRATVKTYRQEVDKVTEVYKPQENMALVGVTFRKVDKTPFFILEKDQTDYKSDKVPFYKTEENGWKINEKGK